MSRAGAVPASNANAEQKNARFDCAEELKGYDHIGHDFWLTRNGHGAGFWDGDYRDRDAGEDYGDQLTSIVKANFAECDVWADGDGGVHLN